jgi:hypothetical protein
MTNVLLIFGLVCVACITALILLNRSLAERAADAKRQAGRMRENCDAEIARTRAGATESQKLLDQQAEKLKRDAVRVREHYESEVKRIFGEAAAGVTESQKLLDQQAEELRREAARIRQHYLDEARKIQSNANVMVKKVLKEVEPLRKFQKLRDAEVEVERQLAQALKEATSLTAEANAMLADARTAATEERAQATRKAKVIHEQADARLDQAIRDAGRIMTEAEKRAQEIGGEAYAALQEKRTLEQAAQAMRNIVEGYGDRYLVPTHSLLDELAAEYGYDAAGQSLASAREQSRRMVEQGQAAACDYAEASRRTTAIQFVIHAFNGSVDATLTRTKSDNYGVLEQKIRDVYAIVNRDGSAFRNARILPTYLEARLAELKWAVVVQELALRDREEQRYLKEQERDRQKAEQERLRKLREAARDTELQRAAVDEAEQRFARTTAELKIQHEQQLARAREMGSSAVEEAEKRHVQEIADLNTANEQRLEEERLKLAEATKRELTIAQQTRKGRIYIISNVGSFGEGVYKIGLTRRDAQERVDELSSASVPFEFDIHGVIETDDAPALEYKIHQHFLPVRVNKINLRKEFFRVTLEDIRKRVESLEHGKDVLGTVTWTEKATAQQYYDSMDIERDGAARERWLQRTRLIAERRQRDAVRISVLDEMENEETRTVEEEATLQ